jgi:magnesium chelatase subunit D
MNVAAPAPGWDAGRAGSLVAVDPSSLGGVIVRAHASSLREDFVRALHANLPPSAPLRRMPHHVSLDRLVGGMSIAATMRERRAVVERGLLDDVGGGLLVVPMAERLERSTAAIVASYSDRSHFALALLDEGTDGEGVPVVLGDRVAFQIEEAGLAEVHHASAAAIAAARVLLPHVTLDERTLTALVEGTLATGVRSVRVAGFVVAAARANAALEGRTSVTAADAIVAARLVLSHRAAAQSQPAEAQQESPPPTDDAADQAPSQENVVADATTELVLAAVAAALPDGALEAMGLGRRERSRSRTEGHSGAIERGGVRGRVIGARAGDLHEGARLHLVETLRAAIPRQRLREPSRRANARLSIRKQDFRIARTVTRRETTVVFVVDASGSAALQRLAETKGAVIRVLADCYARRDDVALVAFRRTEATVILPPTRSLVRARRRLAELAGGGATPLAAGLRVGFELCAAERRRGRTAKLVLLTDGKANVALDPEAPSAVAFADALVQARRFREDATAALLVDIGPRTRPPTIELANALGARYLPLPRLDPAAIARTVKNLESP